MDSAAINSFIPTLDQVDSWYEIFTLLPILIALELLLSADKLNSPKALDPDPAPK